MSIIDESMVFLHENEVTNDIYDSVHITGCSRTVLLMNIMIDTQNTRHEIV